MRTPSGLGIVVVVSACLAAVPAVARPKAAAKENADKADKIDVQALKCLEGMPVSFVPRDVKLACKDEFRDCETDVKLVAKNCSKDFMEFTKLEMFENGRRSLVLEFSPASIVPPGRAWSEKIPWTTAGELEAVVYFRPPGGAGSESARTEVKVRNAGLDSAHAACDACKGTWGRFGVNHKEGCNCHTKDAGKTCHDGDECQGECLFDTYDGQGREVGHCSEVQRLSGCINVVAKGQSKVKPHNPPPRKLPTCLD